MMRKIAKAPSVLLVLLGAACVSVATPTETPSVSPVPTSTEAALSTEQAVRARADLLIDALSRRDLGAVAEMVHPVRGVRFSPYTNVQEDDLVFEAGSLEGLLGDETIYCWGVYDGVGDPMDLAFADYYEDFIYDQDFANAEETSYNEAVGVGNTINNVAEFYPEGVFVEYHFSGFDPDFEGMDWVSLRLVFEREGDTWYLVGVVHDEWTI